MRLEAKADAKLRLTGLSWENVPDTFKLSKLGQFTKAISDYTKVIELNPKPAEAYNRRGTAYGRLGQFSKAISDYTIAITLDPRYAKAYYHRGVAHAFIESLEEAKQDLLKAVELDPSLKTDVKKVSDAFKLNLPLD